MSELTGALGFMRGRESGGEAYIIPARPKSSILSSTPGSVRPCPCPEHQVRPYPLVSVETTPRKNSGEPAPFIGIIREQSPIKVKLMFVIYVKPRTDLTPLGCCCTTSPAAGAFGGLMWYYSKEDWRSGCFKNCDKHISLLNIRLTCLASTIIFLVYDSIVFSLTFLSLLFPSSKSVSCFSFLRFIK